MSYIVPNSSYKTYLSYDFTGKVSRDFSARHAWIQSQAPQLRDTVSSSTPFVVDASGNSVPVPLYFETNDLLQTTADPANVIEIYGDTSDSAAPFTQKRSGLLTTISTPNRITIQNQRDITSYVVGDPFVYNTEFATIQQAITQALLDGVDPTATPKREVQIIVKPGIYPDPFTTQYGIHILGLSSGQAKDVEIRGRITINCPVPSGKTHIVFRNLWITGGIDVNATTQQTVLSMYDCLVETSDINLNATPSPIELYTFNTAVQGINIVLNGSGGISINARNNSSLQRIDLNTCTSFGLDGTDSYVTVDSSSIELNSNFTIRLYNCKGGLSINASAGNHTHLGQNLTLQLNNCFMGGVVCYGNFSDSYVVDSSIGSLNIGDELETDLYVQLSGITAAPVRVNQPFIISGCNFPTTGIVCVINLKSDITDHPNIVLIQSCTFTSDRADVVPGIVINDLSTTNQPTSQQRVEINNCVIDRPIALNYNIITPASIAGGANLFIESCNNIHNILNSGSAPPAGFSCFYGGSTIGGFPSTLFLAHNVYTIDDALTGHVVNGINAPGLNLTYESGLLVSFNNIITNAGASGPPGNVYTGNVAPIPTGLVF
jgi:hypothetical protein